MDEYLSIQEFSKRTGVEISTLRYWDDIGLFSPATRNPDNNYRQYSLSQIITLNFINSLSILNIPLKDIADLCKNKDPEKIMFLLHCLEKKMDLEMRELRLRYSIIHARRELITNGLRADPSKVSIVLREERTVLLWPRNEFKEGDTFLEPLSSIMGQASKYHINLGFPIGGFYENFEAYCNAPEYPQHFFTLDPDGKQILEEGEYLTGFGDGNDGVLSNLPKRMKAYMEENSLEVTGPVYLVYLFDEICAHDFEDYLGEVNVAVSRKSHKAEKRKSSRLRGL